MANARTYSIVLFGATGVTGYGVAEHLAERLKGDPAVKWAIAGRNEAKMLRTKQSLGDAGKNVGILVADSNDFAALVDVAKATRVVISCVGPFMLHGKPLVQACVQEKTHCTLPRTYALTCLVSRVTCRCRCIQLARLITPLGRPLESRPSFGICLVCMSRQKRTARLSSPHAGLTVCPLIWVRLQ